MYSYQKTFVNTIEDLYAKIAQEEIFKLVFNEYPSLEKKYCSPFRKDNSPACYFQWYNQRLIFVDWGSDKMHIDGVQAVIKYFNLPTIAVAIRFIQEQIGNKITIPVRQQLYQQPKKEKQVTSMLPRKREFELRDHLYWKRFGITKEQLLEDHVYPISSVDIKKHNVWKRLHFYDIAYCYELDLDIYKIYRPLTKSKYKWLSNVNKNNIGSFDSLRFESDTLIITKSYKDCRVIRNLGYESVWFQNEGMIPDQFLLSLLIVKYKRIVILYDNDVAGRTAAQQLSNVLQQHNDSKIITIIESPLWYIKDIAEMYCFKNDIFSIDFLKTFIPKLS